MTELTTNLLLLPRVTAPARLHECFGSRMGIVGSCAFRHGNILSGPRPPGAPTLSS